MKNIIHFRISHKYLMNFRPCYLVTIMNILPIVNIGCDIGQLVVI